MGIIGWLRQLMHPEETSAPAQTEETNAEDAREAYRRKKYAYCDLTPLPGCRQEQFTAAGTSFHKAELADFGVPNPDYKLDKMQLYRAGLLDTDVYALNFEPVLAALVPEPENPHDKCAVKILLNGVHVGYIRANQSAFVTWLLATGKVRRVQAQAYGGDYRTLTYDGGYLAPGETATRDELHTAVTRSSIGIAVFIDIANTTT